MERETQNKKDERIEMEMLRFEIRDLLADTKDIDLMRLIYLALLKSK